MPPFCFKERGILCYLNTQQLPPRNFGSRYPFFWEKNQRSGRVVAVIDTGCDQHHQEFDGGGKDNQSPQFYGSWQPFMMLQINRGMGLM